MTIGLNRKSGEIESREKTFSIESDRDLIEIRDFARNLAAKMGFARSDQTIISTAISEICRNVLEYAGTGEILIKIISGRVGKGIGITVSDNGPGIENLELALQEGYSTGNGLGIGLPGAKRIMDDFDIEAEVGAGTVVKMNKWLDSNGFG